MVTLNKVFRGALGTLLVLALGCSASHEADRIYLAQEDVEGLVSQYWSVHHRLPTKDAFKKLLREMPASPLSDGRWQATWQLKKGSKELVVCISNEKGAINCRPFEFRPGIDDQALPEKVIRKN